MPPIRRRQPAPSPLPPSSDLEVTPRDYVMARIAAAQALSQDAADALRELMGLFLAPEDDRGGTRRAELLQEALESFGGATRALESAEHDIGEVDMTEAEPWEE
jgi:hypothetical protein